jgi:hypothetical protein
MTIRIIHHWACSGGTIISRAIANLDNVVFLSEMHPLAYLRLSKPESVYTPTDIIQQLCLPHNHPDPVFCVAAWRGAITALAAKVKEANKILVLRSHSHIDFFTGAQPESDHFISRVLRDTFAINEILTVRHPLDSWISIQREGWDRHFRFGTFEEFCRRALLLVEASRGLPFIRYEEFTINPDQTIRTICDALGINHSDSQSMALDKINLSGDSGRSSNLIMPRERRPIPEPLQIEIQLLQNERESSHYYKLCAKLGYDPSAEAQHPFLASTTPKGHAARIIH